MGALLAHRRGEVFRLDMLQLLVSATALPWFVFIGSHVKRLPDADRRKGDFLAFLIPKK